MKKRVRVKCLVDHVWHGNGVLRKGDTMLLDGDEAEILIEKGQVEKQLPKRKGKADGKTGSK